MSWVLALVVSAILCVFSLSSVLYPSSNHPAALKNKQDKSKLGTWCLFFVTQSHRWKHVTQLSGICIQLLFSITIGPNCAMSRLFLSLVIMPSKLLNIVVYESVINYDKKTMKWFLFSINCILVGNMSTQRSNAL